MGLRDKVLRTWTYFRRGHSTYLAFLISFANFAVIQYRMFIQYVKPLQEFFHSLLLFTFFFALMYIPAAIAIGYFDYKKGAKPVDLALDASASPYSRDLAKAIYLIIDGDLEGAKAVLMKWFRD